MVEQGNSLKIRLLMVGKNQRDLRDAILAQGVVANSAQISNAIHHPEYPKEIMLRGMINDQVCKWEEEAEQKKKA